MHTYMYLYSEQCYTCLIEIAIFYFSLTIDYCQRKYSGNKISYTLFCELNVIILLHCCPVRKGRALITRKGF